MNVQIFSLTVRINSQINEFRCEVENVETFGGMAELTLYRSHKPEYYDIKSTKLRGQDEAEPEKPCTE